MTVIILFAGAKEECDAEPFSDPRVAIGEELNMMTTFFELKKGLNNPKRHVFLQGIGERKKTGDSGKELWRWIPGYIGRYKASNKGQIKRVYRQCTTGGGKISRKANKTPFKILRFKTIKGKKFVNLYSEKLQKMESISVDVLFDKTFKKGFLE